MPTVHPFTCTVLAEAGIAPVAERRLALAARLLAKARALPREDPPRRVAEAIVRPRLNTVTGWRTVGEEVWRATGVTSPIKPLLLQPAQPWDPIPPVSFRLDIGAALPPAPSIERQREVASLHLASLPQRGTWVWTDGSVADGAADGGAGVPIVWPNEDEDTIRTPAGRLRSNYRADIVALQSALTIWYPL